MLMYNRNVFSWAVILFVITVAPVSRGVSAQPPAGPGGAPPAVPVEAVAATAGTVILDVTTVGNLRAAESVRIRPEIPGRVAAIHFSEGQAIKQGTELVTLDATEYRAQLAESAAAVKLDTLSFERAQELFKKKLISRQEYDEAAAKLAASQAKQALDQARLAKTSLRAPFDGVLGLRQVSPGAYVQPGQDIVNLESIDPIKLDFRIPEAYAAQVRASQKVEIKVDAFPGQAFEATVYAVDPRLDEDTRTILLRAHGTNPSGALRPGMFAQVRLELGRHENAVLVPEQALVPMGKDAFVYRVVDGKAIMTKVDIGQRRNAMVEIVKGVSAGDRVVTAGQMKIRDGAPVAVVETPVEPREPLVTRG